MAPVSIKRANPRFSFFADVDAVLGDGTSIRAQLSELSSRGCYLDTLELIPVGTELLLRVRDGVSTYELRGKVIYVHSGGGMGIFGMGIAFGEMDVKQHSAVDTWLRKVSMRTRPRSS
jgi:hypothetical protein